MKLPEAELLPMKKFLEKGLELTPEEEKDARAIRPYLYEHTYEGEKRLYIKLKKGLLKALFPDGEYFPETGYYSTAEVEYEYRDGVREVMKFCTPTNLLLPVPDLEIFPDPRIYLQTAYALVLAVRDIVNSNSLPMTPDGYVPRELIGALERDVQENYRRLAELNFCGGDAEECERYFHWLNSENEDPPDYATRQEIEADRLQMEDHSPRLPDEF